MRKIAIVLALVMTISLSYQVSNVQVEATGLELVVGELLYDLLLSIVISVAGQAFIDEMIEAGYVAGEIELTDIGQFINDNKKLILIAGGVMVVDLITGETDTTVDLNPDDLDLSEGNMAYDLVTGENTVDQQKEDFMDWYFNSVEYVGTYPDGEYKVLEPTWSTATNQYYYVYRFYDTLEEAFSHFPYEYQQLMHEFGEDWVNYYSKVWSEYQVESGNVGSSSFEAGQNIMDAIEYANGMVDTYGWEYYAIFETASYDIIVLSSMPFDISDSNLAVKVYGIYGYRAVRSLDTGEWNALVTNSSTNYVSYASISSADWINLYTNFPAFYNDNPVGQLITSANTSADYYPLDVPVNNDGAINSVIGTPVDVPFEEDENENLYPTPGVIPGVDLPTVGEAGETTELDVAKENLNVGQKILNWIETLVETNSIAFEDDPQQKPTSGFNAPSIPNLLALLVLILIEILLLFIKGFVIVGLIFKIPVSTVLFTADTIEAIDRTKQITLGSFNLSIHELLTWIVTFVFTFLLLKTLKRHLDTFRVT